MEFMLKMKPFEQHAEHRIASSEFRDHMLRMGSSECHVSDLGPFASVSLLDTVRRRNLIRNFKVKKFEGSKS